MSEIKKLKINGQEYTITDGGAVAFDEAQELNEEQKEQARENIGAGSGVYVLGEGETEADVPEGVDVLIDPNGEPLVIPQTLIVTITDDVASHTSAEIYAHAQVGSVMLEQNNERWALNHCDAECAVFEQSLTEEWVFKAVYVYTDGSTERFEAVIPTNYNINSLIDAKLGTTFTEIDTLLGGES